MNKKGFLLAPAVAAVLVGGPGMAIGAAAAPVPASSVVMSVTDDQLSDHDCVWYPGFKYACGSGTYTRSNNTMKTSLRVSPPYLFFAARAKVTTTVYAETEFGPDPIWVVSHELPACGLFKPTCTHNAYAIWIDIPPYSDAQKIQKNASHVVTKVSVR